MQVERLTDHTNADDQLVYRAADEVNRAGTSGDPLNKLRVTLLSHGVGEHEIAALDDLADREVRAAAEAALDEPAPVASRDAKLPLPPTLIDRRSEYRGESGVDRLTMVAALRETLRTRMVKKLSSNVLESSAKDPRLAGLLGKVDQDTVSPKLADQMCSMLGGGCKAPLSDQQIAAGSSKLDASQTKALGDNFSSSLDKVTSNHLVKEGVSKAIAPKLGGIVGALI